MNWLWKLPQYLSWSTPYPLPKDTSDTLMAEGRCDNFGLLLERYLAFGDNRGQAQLVREMADRQALVPDFTPLAELIENYNTRWLELAEDLGALTLSAHPEWRVIVGLGSNVAMGGGILLHPVFGFPVIAASALKGMSRLYAEVVLEQPAEEVERLLGKVEQDEAVRGDLVFLEAIPANIPVVERDVICPIFADYYREGNTPPGSYLTPKPIFFLALGSRSVYRFGVGSLSGDPAAVAEGVRWLRGALTQLGVGAKTAGGYGYWVLED